MAVASPQGPRRGHQESGRRAVGVTAGTLVFTWSGSRALGRPSRQRPCSWAPVAGAGARDAAGAGGGCGVAGGGWVAPGPADSGWRGFWDGVPGGEEACWAGVPRSGPTSPTVPARSKGWRHARRRPRSASGRGPGARVGPGSRRGHPCCPGPWRPPPPFPPASADSNFGVSRGGRRGVEVRAAGGLRAPASPGAAAGALPSGHWPLRGASSPACPALVPVLWARKQGLQGTDGSPTFRVKNRLYSFPLCIFE